MLLLKRILAPELSTFIKIGIVANRNGNRRIEPEYMAS